MFRIIVAEDEPDIRALYAKVLRQNGYEVLEANDCEEVLTLLGNSNADLIISDVMMPKMDGYEMVAALRQMHTNIPILLITAKDSFLDLRKGFLTGADDYMTKPININEMVLRVQALLRRSQMNAEQRCVIGTTTLDYNAFSVTSGTKEQLLPQKEFLLLFKLLSNPGKAFTRLQLMDDVWGYDTDTDPHTVDVHIARLRNRFMDNPDFEIQTIRGMGYRAVKKG
jgi:DNA-binding response OmpR family regulator